MSKRSFHTLLLSGLAGYFSLTALSAGAEPQQRARNGRVSGDLAAIATLAETHVPPACDAAPCLSNVRPLRLHLSGAKSGRISVVLDQLRDPVASGRSMPEVSSQRPLILRGHVTRSAGSPVTRASKRHDAVAVVFRDSKPFRIEVSILPSRSAPAHANGFTVGRAYLSPQRGLAQRNGRIQVPSPFAGRKTRCPHDTQAEPLGDTAGHAQEAQPQAGRYDVLYLATDFDPQFAQSTKCSSTAACNGRIEAAVAQASLFYETRFGVVLEVARQYGPNKHGNSREASELLGSFVDFNNQQRGTVIHDGKNTGKNLVDLFVLFTGRELLDDVYGLTYLSIACRDEFSDVASLIVQRASDSLDPSNIAHHIGHTLSASHTGSGIMRAELREPAPTSWAPTSYLEISSYLNTFYQSCRTGRSDGVRTPTPTPTATPTPDPFSGVPRTIGLAISKTSSTGLSVETTLSKLRPNCLVSIRVAAGPTRARRGVLVKQFSPAKLSSTSLANMPYGIDMEQERDSDMHFFAEYVCRNGKRAEISATEAFNANGKPAPRRRVTKKRWIDLLARAFK